MSRVAGKVAVVTGAAMGLGEAMARLLVREGAAVVVTDINQDAGAGVVAAVQQEGGKAHSSTRTCPKKRTGLRSSTPRHSNSAAWTSW